MVCDVRSRHYYFNFLLWVLRTAGVWIDVRQMVSPHIKIVICLVADP